MSLSDYLEQKLVKHFLSITSYTAPTTIYLGLSTADPLDDGSGIAEPSGSAYARVAVSGWTWNGTASRGDSSGATNFPTATGSWGTVTHAVYFDASSSGNILGSVQLKDSGGTAAPQTIGTGNTLTFAAGDLSLALD